MAEALNSNHLVYTGQVQPIAGTRDASGLLLQPYLPDEALIEAVNLSLYLERPLLIKGEPGSGKTRLARAVAYELGLPYEAWYVKSTSRAQDGLYTYDILRRLHDAQLAALGTQGVQSLTPEHYIQWGPLGRAFQSTERTVLLIDEVDKADIDFPNDLLLELDERRFIIEETRQAILAKEPPIVFITSNDEKDLPDAFLRRCLFHYIEFPKRQRLIEIISAHFPDAPAELIEVAVRRFQALREEMYTDKGGAGKKVSTSELIDWFRVLNRYPQDEILMKLDKTLPFASVLLKNWDDHRRYLIQASSGRMYSDE